MKLNSVNAIGRVSAFLAYIELPCLQNVSYFVFRLSLSLFLSPMATARFMPYAEYLCPVHAKSIEPNHDIHVLAPQYLRTHASIFFPFKDPAETDNGNTFLT
jgi:hypothetical protein